jgi:hypothetical protein
MNHRLALKSAMFGAEACALLLLLWIAIHSLIVRLLLAIAMCGALLSAEIYFVFLIARQLWRWSERITSLVVPGVFRPKGKAVHMNSGSFDGGLLNLTNWIGNAVMPILAALILASGIYKFSRGYQIEPYVAGTMSALSVSGLLRLAEVFASQGSGTSQYWSAILSLANWVGNVILPVYGGIEIARAVLGLGGFFERLNIGDDWMRHFLAGGACLCLSGLMRLMEHFVAAGTNGVA